MKIDKKILWIQILALTGLVLSIKLSMIFHTANYEKYALSSFCSINDFIDCDGVAKSIYAQFLGIPLAWWGVFFYIIILFLSIVDKLKNVKFLKFLEVFKNPTSYITTLASIAFMCSMVLAYISFHKINKLCILCLITYFIDFIIALVASSGMFKNIVASFKTTVLDFIDGAKKYTKTAIVLILLFVSFLAYSGITLNFVPNVKKLQGILKYRNMKFNKYRVKGNTLGDENAKVIVELYSDYVCPHCYINNIMLHQAMKELKNVKVIHHNMPFDKECNPYITINMHPNACFMSKGAIAAKNQNNYWEMSSLLYENKPKNMEELTKLAEQLNFDIDKFEKDVNSNETAQELRNEIYSGYVLAIDSTPTMFINGKRQVGIRQYKDLKELLIENGAQPR